MPDVGRPAPSHRMRQVDELLRGTLAQLIERDLEFPAGVVVTITRVLTTGDFSSAQVWVSVLPAAQAAAVWGQLTAALPGLQKHVAGIVQFQHMPTLTLVRDDSAERAAHITDLLDGLRGS